MDFRERELNFQEADRRYAELAQRREAGSISNEEFDAQRQQLMVRDNEGRWWAKLGESGEWHYRDGGRWVQGAPPAYKEVASDFQGDSSLLQAPSSANPESTKNNERWKIPSWIFVVGLGGMALVGGVLIFWALVPYLRGEPASDEQGGSMRAEQGGSGQDGGAFGAVFIHRATPENVSANSTYLDNPLTNDDPNIILYVTPNWNPGGSAGIYNDHPIGVWYDDERQRWAIFNQDREPMPEGAAFNVGVLEEPTEAG